MKKKGYLLTVLEAGISRPRCEYISCVWWHDLTVYPKSRRQGPERRVPTGTVVVAFNWSTQVILLGVYEKKKENNKGKKKELPTDLESEGTCH